MWEGRGLGGMLHPAWRGGRNWLRRATSPQLFNLLGAAPRRDSMPLGFDPPTALRSRAFFFGVAPSGAAIAALV